MKKNEKMKKRMKKHNLWSSWLIVFKIKLIFAYKIYKFGYSSVSLIENITINISNFVGKSISFSEEIRAMDEKVTCIFNVAATSTTWIQCILEVIFKLIFTEVTKPKS